MPFGLPNVSYLGFPAPALAAAHAGLGFRAAKRADLPAVLSHFSRLTPECRRRRFCATLSPEALERHAAGLWDRSALVLAAIDGPLWGGAFHRIGEIRAMAELSLGGREAEIGLSVDDGQRRRGIGTYLVQTAAWLLAPRGVDRIAAYTTADNIGMIRLAIRLGGRIDRASSDVEMVFDVACLRRDYLRRRMAERVFARAG